MADASGAFPRIPQDVALQVKSKIEDLMQHVTKPPMKAFGSRGDRRGMRT